MKKSQTLLSVTVLDCGQFDSSQVHSFEDRNKAKSFILAFLSKESKATGETPVSHDGGTVRLWEDKEGTFSYSVGTNTYVFSFLNEPGSGAVSDNEVLSVLDSYVNSDRPYSEYEKTAQLISENMHRYCQNNLWKFIKQIIRAFASGLYDDRNKTAHHQAGDVLEFMEQNDIK